MWAISVFINFWLKIFVCLCTLAKFHWRKSSKQVSRQDQRSWFHQITTIFNQFALFLTPLVHRFHLFPNYPKKGSIGPPFSVSPKLWATVKLKGGLRKDPPLLPLSKVVASLKSRVKYIKIDRHRNRHRWTDLDQWYGQKNKWT